MSDAWFEDQLFEKLDASRQSLVPGTYDACRFLMCNLEGADLGGFHFIDCSFEQCNMGNVKMPGTSLRAVTFRACKLIGVGFDQCHEIFFDVQFDQCILDFSNFHCRKMAGRQFLDCSLREADFTEADLTGASFEGADLQGAVFDQTRLEKADFRGAFHYMMDPERNQVKKAKFSLDGLPGLLGKYDLEIF